MADNRCTIIGYVIAKALTDISGDVNRANEMAHEGILDTQNFYEGADELQLVSPHTKLLEMAVKNSGDCLSDTVKRKLMSIVDVIEGDINQIPEVPEITTTGFPIVDKRVTRVTENMAVDANREISDFNLRTLTKFYDMTEGRSRY